MVGVKGAGIERWWELKASVVNKLGANCFRSEISLVAKNAGVKISLVKCSVSEFAGVIWAFVIWGGVKDVWFGFITKVVYH